VCQEKFQSSLESDKSAGMAATPPGKMLEYAGIKMIIKDCQYMCREIIKPEGGMICT
jgi:hypothetical protein